MKVDIECLNIGDKIYNINEKFKIEEKSISSISVHVSIGKNNKRDISILYFVKDIHGDIQSIPGDLIGNTIFTSKKELIETIINNNQ